MSSLSCPCCRTKLHAAEGSAGPLYRCADGHGYTPRSLLQEQEKLAARMLRDVKASLEAHLAFSAELVSKARADDRPHLLRHLERVLSSGRDTLWFVQGSLRGPEDLPE